MKEQMILDGYWSVEHIYGRGKDTTILTLVEMTKPRGAKNLRFAKGPGPWCGTISGYMNHQCRCGRCTRVASTRMARNKQRRIAQGIPDKYHGTVTGYRNYDCRCEPCTKAASASQAERRKKGVR